MFILLDMFYCFTGIEMKYTRAYHKHAFFIKNKYTNQVSFLIFKHQNFIVAFRPLSLVSLFRRTDIRTYIVFCFELYLNIYFYNTICLKTKALYYTIFLSFETRFIYFNLPMGCLFHVIYAL